MKKVNIEILVIALIFALTGCEKDHGVNLFSKKQDVEFGLQMKNQIDSSGEYNVLDPATHSVAYGHINRIMHTILDSSDNFSNKDIFNWEVNIIDDDVLNAFACPGGYMYFYTGLIKYLDNESQLAGVMAHEMAHVELRHSTRQLTSMYGYQITLDMLFGKADTKLDSVTRGITGNLSFLAFSRDYEYQADEYAVKFLSDTDYDPLGVAGFFEKLEAEGETSGRIPVFLSTHPSPEDRIEKIHEHWAAEGSKTGNNYVERYQAFKNSLP